MSADPGEGIPSSVVVAERVTYLIISDALSSVACEKISPLGVCITVGIGGYGIRRKWRHNRVGLPEVSTRSHTDLLAGGLYQITRIVVCVGKFPVKYVVGLLDKLSKIVVLVVDLRAVYGDLRDVTVLIVGIRIGRSGATVYRARKVLTRLVC